VRPTALICLFTLSVAVAAPLADVWDVQSDNDNSSLTDNELVHGTTQLHDLGALAGPVADQDWYLMPQPPQSSWEVIVDGVSGDLGFSGLAVDRIAADDVTVLQSAAAAVTGSFGYSRALRWAHTAATTEPENYIRVSGGACSTACGADDVYTIRARETTINVARWNQSGSQVTVLLTQNTTNRPVNATFFYYSAAGALLQTGNLTGLAAKALNVFNLGGFGSLVGNSGHIVIAHDAGYGGLNVKTVALEPATGFSFDTPGVYKPY
jgi:hypothetical protein